MRVGTGGWLLVGALMAIVPASVMAQAGGGGAAGAGGAAASASAGAAGHGAGAGAGQGAATGQAGQAAGQQTAAQSAAAQYAAGTSAGVDPRKPPPAGPGALTLRQVVDAAQLRNPTLLAAQANLRAVRAQELQAGVRTNPYFTLPGTEITEPAYVNNPYSYSAQFSRLFERGDKRRYRLDYARANTAQTQAQLEDTSSADAAAGEAGVYAHADRQAGGHAFGRQLEGLYP